MKKILSIFLSASLSWGQAQPSVQVFPSSSGSGSFPNGTTQVSAAYNTPGIWLSPTCPNTTSGVVQCIKINADGKMITDGTSNSTTTFTAPDGNWTSADVGKIFWATTAGSGTIPLNNTTFVCPQTTIASVTNSTTIVLNAPCTASGSANVVAFWGHDDGPTLAAASFGCNIVHVASGNNLILFSQPIFDTAPLSTTCPISLANPTGAPWPSLIGDGAGASQTMFVLTPNFNWAGCTVQPSGASQPICVGANARVLANLQFYGGLNAASNTNCANGANKTFASIVPHSGTAYGLDIAGICAGQSGMVGYEANSYDTTFDAGGVQDAGQYACKAFGGKMMSMRSNYCSNPDGGGSALGLWVTGSAQFASWSGYSVDRVQIDSGSILSSWFTNYAALNGSVVVASGGTFVTNHDTLNSLALQTGSPLVESTNTTYASISNSATSKGFVDLGGNILTGATSALGHWAGNSIWFGSGSGTCTAATTLYLYGFGQNSTTACTATAIAGGKVLQQLPLSGTLKGLTGTSTHGGVNASDGVLTIYANGVATALTCTMGTSGFCADNTHSYTPAIGDVISCGVTTQSATVLAGVGCYLLDW